MVQQHNLSNWAMSQQTKNIIGGFKVWFYRQEIQVHLIKYHREKTVTKSQAGFVLGSLVLEFHCIKCWVTSHDFLSIVCA